MDLDPLIISLVSACTALVASVAGPTVTPFVAKRQVNATVLSANRQKWIETLRDALAELISLLVAALVFRSGWKEEWDSGRGALTKDPALLEKLQRMVLVRSRIMLLINPTEADHQRLVAAIDVALERLRQEQSPDADTEKDIQAITDLAQAAAR